MRDNRTPTQKAIWEGILKLIEALPEPTGGTSRNPASWTDYPAASGGTGTEGRTQYVTYNSDGTKTIREIIVIVRERRDDNDDFWEMQLADRSNALVINGKHYRIGSDNGRNRVQGPFKGFGGRRFDVQMLDGGAILHIDDLWYQGPIPPKFRELMPDNARWINPDQEPFR